MSGLGYINYYIDCNCKVEDYFARQDVELSESDKGKIVNEIGLKSISLIKEDYYNIVVKLIADYLSATHVEKDSIRYIIFTGEVNSSENLLFKVQQYFEFPSVSVLQLVQACSSSLYAVGMLASMLKKGERGLIISGCYEQEMNQRFIGYSVVSDGIGIMEIVNDDSYLYEILEFRFLSGIEFAGKDRMKIVNCGVSLINNLIKDANISKKDIDLFIPQNINKVGYEILYAKLLSIDADKMFLENIARTGHVGDVDAIVNLKDCIDNKKFKTALLYAVGAINDYYNFNGVIIRKRDKNSV